MARIFTYPVMRGLILLAAIVVWVNVYAGTSHPKTLQSQVTILSLDNKLAVVDPITEVEANISGTPYALGKISDDTFNFVIDLSNISAPGKYSADIVVASIPESVKLMQIKPKKIVFNVDYVTSKIVPVVTRTTGWVADNYSVKNVEIVPNRVTIHGASSSLNAITNVKARVSIDGRNRSFTAPVTYRVEVAEGVLNHSVWVTPVTGVANVEIGEGTSFRNLGLKASFRGELPGGFWVQEVVFEPQTIMVRGTQGKLDQLTHLQTTLIDLNNKTQSFKTSVAVDLPEGVEVVGENLIYTTVNVESSENTRTMSIAPTYANVTEKFGVTSIVPSNIRVVVAGNPDILNGLNRSMIRLNVDLQGALSGANIIDITSDMFNTNEGLSVVSYKPNQIEIILSRLQ